MAHGLGAAPGSSPGRGAELIITAWIYPLLFTVIFAETGFVVTPFLPGDSLLFAVGRARRRRFERYPERAACERGAGGGGGARQPGQLQHRPRHRPAGLQRPLPPAAGGIPAAHRGVFPPPRRHGDLPVALHAHHPHLRAVRRRRRARCPIARFFAYNLAGGCAWVALFICGGYLFGNVPLVKQHFALVTLGIVVVSLVPVAAAPCCAALVHRRKSQEAIFADISFVSTGQRRGSMHTRCDHLGSRALHGKVGRTDFGRLRRCLLTGRAASGRGSRPRQRR